MSENPYQSPSAEPQVVGVNSGSREDLRSVAKYQKGILVCILIYLVAVIGQFAVPEEVRAIIGLGVLGVGLVGTVFVFLLAIKVYNTVVGVLLGILTLVPCIGLIVLLVVNGKATAVLKQNGIKVGLLGANLSQIYPTKSGEDADCWSPFPLTPTIDMRVRSRRFGRCMTLQSSFTVVALIRKPTLGNRSACGDVEFDDKYPDAQPGIPPRPNFVISLDEN